MIDRTKRIHLTKKKAVLIYKLGIGYLYQLQYILDKIADINNDSSRFEVVAIILRFTNLSKTQIWKWYYFKSKYISTLINEIISFNFYNGKTQEGDNETKDNETPGCIIETLYDAVHVIAYYYHWTSDYILENITLSDLKALSNRIQQENLNLASLSAIAYHDPKQLSNMMKVRDGYTDKSLSDVLHDRRKIKSEAKERAERNIAEASNNVGDL